MYMYVTVINYTNIIHMRMRHIAITMATRHIPIGNLQPAII